jgi:hypothetical protein
MHRLGDRLATVDHGCGGIWRIQRQFGEKAFAREIAAGDLLELDQLCAPGVAVFVDAVETRTYV